MGCGSVLNPFSADNPITGSLNQKLGIDEVANKVTGALLPQDQENFINDPVEATQNRIKDFEAKHKATRQTVGLLLDGEGGSDAWTRLGKQVLDEGNASKRILTGGDPLTDYIFKGQQSARDTVDKYAQGIINPKPRQEPTGSSKKPMGAGAVNAKSFGNTGYSSSALYEEGQLPGSINTANYKK